MKWIETKGKYKRLMNLNNMVFIRKCDESNKIIFRLVTPDNNISEIYDSELERDNDYERIAEELRKE